jgi:putative hydroxymethylpyrimidine transport system substrate-binding protein
MRVIFAVTIAVGALFIAGCGGEGKQAENAQAQAASSRPLRNVTVTLDGYEGPENVGILMAQQRGYFADAGLSVSIFSPVHPARPVQYVATRQDDFGVTQEPQLIMAKAKGAPVIAVGSLVHRSTAAMIWLKKSGIGGIAGLKGKTIAIPGVPFQKVFLADVLARQGLTLDDVKVKSVGYELVPSLVSGRVDAIFGGSWNLEGAELEAGGLQPVITRLQSLGFPPYDESTLIARPDRVAKDSGLVRDFVSAVARGTAAAIEDPQAAADAIEEGNLGGRKVSRKALEAEVAETVSLLSKSGYMYPEEAILLVDWMHQQGMINQFPTATMLLTNEYASWRP